MRFFGPRFRIPWLAFVLMAGMACSTPGEPTVRREFSDRYPKATIEDIELFFEQDGVPVYLITAREKGISEEA